MSVCNECGGSGHNGKKLMIGSPNYAICGTCHGTGEEPQEVAKVELLTAKEMGKIADKIETFIIIPAQITALDDRTKIPMSFWEQVMNEVVGVMTQHVNTAVLAERDRIMAVLPDCVKCKSSKACVECLTEVKKIIQKA